MDEQQDSPENPPSSTAMPPPPLLPTMQLVDGTPMATGKRPTAATVIGIMLLLLAGIALYSFLSFIFKAKPDNSSSVNGLYPAWFLMANVIAGVITFLVDLIMGVGLLRMMAWARIGSVIWLSYEFLQDTIFAILATSFAMDYTKSYAINSSAAGSSISQASMFVAIIFVVVFFLVFYGLMIFFLSRPAVVAAFKQIRKSVA